MSCHMHQPNSFLNTYLGYTMWDYETDAELLWPKQQKYPTEEEKRASLEHNPEGAAPRGLWTNIDFLEKVSSLNAQAKNTQFADYHGHGSNIMAVYKRDRKENLLDANDNVVAFDDPQKFAKAVHLKDIHLEKGMHCADCHFSQDEHGNGQLYAEYGNNIEIECQDCHGTTGAYTNLRTSGPAAPPGGTDLLLGTTPFGQRRFVWVNGVLWQRSMVNPGMQWEVVQVKDTITPGAARYNERSAYAKTIKSADGGIAHTDAKMTCYACHTSWMTSCGGCHLTKANDNNAWLAQLLLQGTNFVNFIGRYAWVATDDSIEAVAVTEWDEPQTVIGSSLHKIVYPDYYAKHEKNKDELQLAHEHHSKGARSVQTRGEYAFVARGKGGFEVYDIANVDNKDFSERITSAPVSPFGQRTYVRTKFASAVALPTTMPMAPDRTTGAIPENQEQPIHPLYKYAYIADREEGLILVDVTTLTDGNPSNNFFTRALTWNPGGVVRASSAPPSPQGAPEARTTPGILDGANSIYVAGRWLFIGASQGVVVIDIDNPLQPKVVSVISEIPNATGIAVQFRYAFVTDKHGLHTIDITDPAHPRVAGMSPLDEAGSVYVARRYASVAAGKQGMAIINVENPERPLIDQIVVEDLHDVNDVKVASTNASAFAYVADGEGGLKVFQLTSPEWTPWYAGFSPHPVPRLIAHKHTHGPALAISKGLDRDRAVDESGYQVSIFNRIGARPMTLQEMQRLYLRNGQIYTVSEGPK